MKSTLERKRSTQSDHRLRAIFTLLFSCTLPVACESIDPGQPRFQDQSGWKERDFTIPTVPLDARLVEEQAEFLEGCEEDEDCLSGLCIEGPAGDRVCTRRCFDDCPEDYDCALYQQGPDPLAVCLPDGDDLCRPCEVNSDCDDWQDLCLRIGNFGYCGEACASDDDCPNGYRCEDAPLLLSENPAPSRPGSPAPEDRGGMSDASRDRGGDASVDRGGAEKSEDLGADRGADQRRDQGPMADRDDQRLPEGEPRGGQCVPVSGACAPCLDEDGDGYGEGGDCLGFDCNDADSVSHVGAPERCDGVDNDCDTQIDEALGDTPPADLNCLQEGLCAGSAPSCLEGDWR